MAQRKQRELFATEGKKEVESGPITRAQALDLTSRIIKTGDSFHLLLLEAYEREVWRVLGYGSWHAYAVGRLKTTRGQAYRRLDQARVNVALSEAAGLLLPGYQNGADKSPNSSNGKEIEKSPAGDSGISDRTAREIKGALPAVIRNVRQRVKKGEEPAKAIKGAVKTATKKARKAKAAKKARKPATKKPAAKKPDEPEGLEPDFVEEFERMQKENERLTEIVETLKTGKVEKEYAKLTENYGRLEGRLQQALQSAADAAKDAKYGKDVLAKIRKALKVDRDAEILEAIADLKR